MGKKSKESRGNATSRITDPRFASFETDPRFRLPSTKKTKTTIDKRFARMLDSDEFVSAAKVDRYGRRLKSDAGKKALKNLYRTEEEEEEEEEEEKKSEKESEDEEEKVQGQGDEEEEEEDVVEVDNDAEVEKQLKAADSYDPARHGGFSSSEDEDEESEEEEDDDDVGASMQRFAEQQADVEEGDVTKRIAVVNMDWDHIKSHDLFALFSSFLTQGDGSINKVSVYPSEFGKERMQREEIEGPPREIFRKSKRGKADEEEDSDSDAEDERIKKELLQEDNDADFDGDALRSYQLDRLRYYYAVVTCSDSQTAKKIYDAVDGTEYLSSSNFIDLRFVPDDVTFDDRARDECTDVPDDYEPVDFVTNALQSSKVKLTWDMHPEEASRKQSMKKAFSGSRAELQENDLRAYLASDSEDEDEADAKEEARRKMRAALGLGAEELKGAKDEGPVGDMEITFTSALLDGPKKKEEGEEETTIEKYKRKERERKQKRKERAVANREGEQDSDAGAEADGAAADGEDLGFDDPFFTTEEPEISKSQQRKEERRKKREAREAEEQENAAEKARLQKMMDEGEEEDGMGKFKHFDMKEIRKAEKEKDRKKKRKGKKGAKDGDVGALAAAEAPALDDRFKSIFESHEYAVDTSNPQYTGTQTMQKMLAEGRKRKEAGDGGEGERVADKKKRKREEGAPEVDLGGLVASVKKKAKAKGKGKAR